MLLHVATDLIVSGLESFAGSSVILGTHLVLGVKMLSIGISSSIFYPDQS